MLSRVMSLSSGAVRSAIIVDQSRQSEEQLRKLPLVSDVLTFEPDFEQIAVEGHDHPAALDRALKEGNYETSHILVLDSDAFPVSDSWIQQLDNIALALVPGSKTQTHPCLMAFPSELRHKVSFSEDYLLRAKRKGAPDTGRRVGKQLSAAGEKVTLLTPSPAFNGYRGSFYLNQAFYHHGHGSFVSGDHVKYKGFVSSASERLYRRRVLQGKFSLTSVDFVALATRHIWRILINRIRLLLENGFGRQRSH